MGLPKREFTIAGSYSYCFIHYFVFAPILKTFSIGTDVKSSLFQKNFNNRKLTKYSKIIFDFEDDVELGYESPIIKNLCLYLDKYIFKLMNNRFIIYGCFINRTKLLEILEICNSNKNIYKIKEGTVEIYGFKEELFEDISLGYKVMSNMNEEEMNEIKKNCENLKKMREYYENFNYEEYLRKKNKNNFSN